MIKLNEQDIVVLLTIIENTQFAGKDVMAVSELMKKLYREMEKINPQYKRNINGSK